MVDERKAVDIAKEVIRCRIDVTNCKITSNKIGNEYIVIFKNFHSSHKNM